MTWAEDFLHDAHHLDIAKLAAWFDDNVTVKFANNPAVNGKAHVLELFQGFWSQIRTMNHDVQLVTESGDSAVAESLVSYLRPDGKHISMPVASCMHRTEKGVLDRLFIYIDIAPLYAA